MSYVPKYLKPYLYPYHGEFCYTPIFQTRFIAQVMAEGFLPVATQGMLLPKLHNHRCVVRLTPDELHVSKSVRKKCKRFTISINQRLEDVIKGCHEQHGSHCWLYPPLVEAFREMMQAQKVEASVMDEATGKPLPNRSWTVRLYTVEVWNQETGALAGGELGYTVGSIYTSLTGFTKEDSAGSVQLIALGRLLKERGYHLWDLGMDMEYKRGIGSHLMPRATFVSEVHRVRETHGHLVLPSGEQQNCKDVIDRNAPPNQQLNQQQQKQKAKQKAPKAKNKGDNKPATREQSHTPPVAEAEAPIKKRVRKSDSEDELEM